MAEEKILKEATDESIKEELAKMSKGKADSLKVKTMELTESEMNEAMEEVKEYESNEDNFITTEELGSKLLTQKGASKLTLKEKRKSFTEKGARNPEGEDVTMNDKDEDYMNYLELEASYQSGKNGHPLQFITGTVDSVEFTENMDNVLISCYMGAFEVKIPVSEFMWIDGVQGNKFSKVPVEELHKYAVMRIGTECKFKVEAIDAKNKVAYASRLRALGVEGFANYVRPEANGQPRYTVGQKVLAKVVCVQDSFVICEAFGAEFKIKDEELAWAGMDNVYKYFSIGDTFYVKILAVGYEVIKMPNGNKYKKVNVVASKRLIDPNPFKKYASRYRDGVITNAVVTRVGDSGMRLTLGTKRQPTISSVFCEYPLFLPRDERPKVGDTVRVMVMYTNKEKEFIRVRFEKVLMREE